MNAVPKPRMGQRSWTDVQRAQQAAKLHARKPNYEYRMTDRAELRAMNTYLRTQESYTDLLRIFHKQWDRLNDAQHEAIESQLVFLENELIAIERQIFGGVTFYELLAGNILPFRPPKPKNSA